MKLQPPYMQATCAELGSNMMDGHSSLEGDIASAGLEPAFFYEKELVTI